MSLRLGDDAPDFTAETTEGTISFHDWIGDGWAILFSHPKDFTPVCTTELGYLAGLKAEFDKRNCKVMGLSVDPLSDHRAWSKDIEETQGHALNYPLIADDQRSVAELYDMIHPNELETLTVRSVFVIGPDKKVKLTLTYPASTGRNFDEVLRAIDSLQLTDPPPGRDAGGLDRRPGRDHRSRGQRRRGEGALPQGLEGPQALPARHAAAEPLADERTDFGRRVLPAGVRRPATSARAAPAPARGARSRAAGRG